MTQTISHGWETDEPDDPTKDVSARNLNDHEVAYSGLTSGHVLRATGATTADFGALQDGDLPSTIARDSEVTSAIASALSGLGTVYQPLDSDLSAIAALTTTAFGRGLLALASASAARTALALGTASLEDAEAFDAAGTAASAVSAHSSDTTSVHGIADTTDLVLDDDARLTNSRTPSGSAGGVLSGTYPNPGFASDMATQAELDAHAADTTSVHGISDTSALLTTTSADAAYQPKDSDLTAIAALTTTSFGRALLALADAAALLSAAGAAASTHSHAGEDVTSGTVADARIASTIARDSEVTSAIAALSSVYQPLDSDLTSIAALTTTSYGRAFLALADAAALRTAGGLVIGTDVRAQGSGDPTRASLGLATSDAPQFAGVNVGAATDTTITRTGAGDIAVEGNAIYRAGGTDVPVADGGTGASDAAGARTNLGLVIGTDVQAQDAELAALAGLTSAADRLPYFTGSGAASLATFTGAARNLLDDADAAAMRATLSAAAASHTHTFDVALPFVIDGGTSAITTGSKGFIPVPFAGTITAVRLAADASGSIVVDIKKASYSGLFSTSSIVASAKPTLSSAQKSEDTTLTGWTTAISAGDWLEFNVDSAATVKRVTLALTISRTV